MKRFPGNCVVVSLAAWLRHPRTTTIHVVRNRAGRWHMFWQRAGVKYEFYTPGASRCGYLRNSLRIGLIRVIADTQAPAPKFVPPARTYDKREVVLPSGRFASMATITWADLVVTHNQNAMLFVSALATRCVAIDGVPMTEADVMVMPASEFFPIAMMLGDETKGLNTLARGIA